MRRQFGIFLIRLVLNACGLWIAIRVLGTGYNTHEITGNIGAFLLAGLIFSVINAILRPIVIILSLPAILLTLGLFIVVVNGFMVYISLLLVPGLHITFWHALLAGLVMSLLNYVVSGLLEQRAARYGEQT